MLEVIVPTVRTWTVQRLIESLALGTVKPDLVTLVSNEIESVNPHGLDVQVLRFSSRYYPIGFGDVALRRDIGAFSSSADYLVFQDDDQIAPPNMIEASSRLFEERDIFWGHHRFLPFEGKSVAEISSTSPLLGISRENPVPPAYHSWQSCYAGMFGIARREFLDSCGFDLLFLCHHEGEDQNLGRRLMLAAGGKAVLIDDPPFAWHPIDRDHSYGNPVTNICPTHAGVHFDIETLHGMKFERCPHCPYFRALDKERFFTRDVILPFDPELVEIAKEKQWPQ